PTPYLLRPSRNAGRMECEKCGLGSGLAGDFVLAMLQGVGDRVLVEPRAVVALDQQRHGAALLDALGEAERLVEVIEFLKQPPILIDRRGTLGAGCSGEDLICHWILLCFRSVSHACTGSPFFQLSTPIGSLRCGAHPDSRLLSKRALVHNFASVCLSRVLRENG